MPKRGAEDACEQKEEEKEKNITGDQPGSNEDSQGGTETTESDKEEENRGPRGGNLSLGVGVDQEPARKDDTSKTPRHVPGGT
ncbi:hypothetical protein NDU88_003052 [Pleurodeles waltl]|uniref:Uncharacterized protein n=1 Tax=Pleurodeles waltl TaxID=8319 RepID=A0AAV7VF19_PLEWA|nr:hypothetical protein NDU88_003052 [Pleurodeles waltl]